jgi:RNA polymerase sigma factor (sigma-70 family)
VTIDANQHVDLICEVAKKVAASQKQWGRCRGRYQFEDLVSIAVLAGLQYLPHYKPGPAQLATFLSRRMVGAIQDEIRREFWPRYLPRRAVSPLFCEIESESIDPAVDADPARPLAVREELDRVRTALLLSRREWQVIMLRIGHGLTQDQVAHVLGMTGNGIAQMELTFRRRFGGDYFGRLERQGGTFARSIRAELDDVSGREGARPVPSLAGPDDLRPAGHGPADREAGRGAVEQGSV